MTNPTDVLGTLGSSDPSWSGFLRKLRVSLDSVLTQESCHYHWEVSVQWIVYIECL